MKLAAIKKFRAAFQELAFTFFLSLDGKNIFFSENDDSMQIKTY